MLHSGVFAYSYKCYFPLCHVGVNYYKEQQEYFQQNTCGEIILSVVARCKNTTNFEKYISSPYQRLMSLWKLCSMFARYISLRRYRSTVVVLLYYISVISDFDIFYNDKMKYVAHENMYNHVSQLSVFRKNVSIFCQK